MLAHPKRLMEYQNDMVIIIPSLTKLVISLRTPAEDSKGGLYKKVTRHSTV
jgi:hypothetical protein